MASKLELITNLEAVRRRFWIIPENAQDQANLIRTAYPANSPHPILRRRHATERQIGAVAREIYDRAHEMERYASLERFLAETEGMKITGGRALRVGGEDEPSYEGMVIRLAAGKVTKLLYWDSPLVETHLANVLPTEWRTERYLEGIERQYGIAIERAERPRP